MRGNYRTALGSTGSGGEQGVTLIELLIVVAMVAILLTVGVPSFEALANRTQVQGETDQFREAMQRARQEALSRGVAVSVCQRDNNDTCAGGDNAEWEQGWLVFVDDDNDGARASGETILHVKQGLRDGYTLRPKGDAQALTFEASGGTDNAYVFRVCGPDADTSEGDKLRLNVAGRVNNDGEPQGCS